MAHSRLLETLYRFGLTSSGKVLFYHVIHIQLWIQTQLRKKEFHNSTMNLKAQWLPSESCLVVSDSLQTSGLYPARLLCPRNSPDKNTGVDSRSLLQGIFPTQGSNPGLPHCRWTLYCLNHQGNPMTAQVSP